ncbi:DUF2269 domain-containing protein [Streptomyces sp. NPDC051940]|uniref:DUF2269 domain-containing protein n=1 Tax=Streptomyces sp. NPDC051940 TaxID=3155675 RepID=UPI0034132112
MQLTRRPRRAALVVHVVVSVGWLGLSLGLLALSIAGYTSGSAAVAEASYRSMKVFTDWLILPIAFTTLLSGVLLSLGTVWGLARHRWVWIKFWLTLIATTATVFSLRPAVNSAASDAIARVPVEAGQDLLFAPSVSLSIYLFCTVVSVLKPWGLTRRGRRLREARVAGGAADRKADRAAGGRTDRKATGRTDQKAAGQTGGVPGGVSARTKIAKAVDVPPVAETV